MAKRILHDPHLETTVDCGPHHAVLRAALTQSGMSEYEAILAINNSWTQVHNDCIALLDQQVADDAGAFRQQQQREEQQAALLLQEKEQG